MEPARAAGRRLAERHRDHATEADPAGSLVNYAESPRAGDWTLRSAMTRLAQPEPGLVDAIAPLVRRLDAVLHHVARPLEKRTVVCDRQLSVDNADGAPLDPYPDTRTADLARLAASAGGDADVVVDAYIAEEELGPEEIAALPLLDVALRFDAMAEALVVWAQAAPAAVPIDLVESTTAAIRSRLDELGVPEEQGPPPRGGRRRGA